MTHTKGPWKLVIEKEFGEYGTVLAKYISAISDTDDNIIVTFEDDFINMAHNARLIADAPMLLEQRDELLEALERLRNAEKDCIALRNFDVGFEEWADVAELKEAQSEADTAIRKAKS